MIVRCATCGRKFEQTKRVFKFIHEDAMHKICPNCIEYMKSYFRTNVKHRKEHKHKIYKERVSSGICVFCGSKTDNGLVYCNSCKEKRSKRKPLLITEKRLSNLKPGDRLLWKVKEGLALLKNSYGIDLESCPIIQKIEKVDNIIYLVCDNLTVSVDMNSGYMSNQYKVRILHIVKGEVNETSH